MSAGTYNIKIDQGSDFSLQLTVQEDGSAKNLTGFSARAQMRPTIDSSTLTATFTCSITSAANGTLTMALGNTTTDDIDVGQYYYDLELFTSTTSQRLIQGTATIAGEVTR
jgi:hypothetical protein